MDSDFEAGSGYNLPIFYEIQGYIYYIPPPGGGKDTKNEVGKIDKNMNKEKKEKRAKKEEKRGKRGKKG